MLLPLRRQLHPSLPRAGQPPLLQRWFPQKLLPPCRPLIRPLLPTRIPPCPQPTRQRLSLPPPERLPQPPHSQIARFHLPVASRQPLHPSIPLLSPKPLFLPPSPRHLS